jgi:hypothetical protein
VYPSGVPGPESNPSFFQIFALPALFTTLGAVLGFFAWRARQAKASFIKGVRIELDALDKQLDETLREVTESIDRVKQLASSPRFAGIIRRSVFDGQVQKLKDVSDPLVIEVIHFYSDLGLLEQIFASVNDLSVEYARTTSEVQKPAIQNRLLSSLRVLTEKISGFRGQIGPLRTKLETASKNAKKAKRLNN